MGVSHFEPSWLAWDETQTLIVLCAASHIEMCFVGGAVRDALMGYVPSDIDMITSAKADYVMSVLQTAGIYAELRDPLIGLVVMFIHGKRYDIISLPDLHRHESFITKVKLYLEQQYDFTLNGVFLTPSGELHDPFGGVGDVQAGRVIFIGDAQTSIIANPNHILRYFRMVAVFGNGDVDAVVLALCIKCREELRRIVGWRRYQEVLKISMAPKGVRILRLMAREGILAEALDFVVSDLQSLEHLVAIEGMLKIKPDLETRIILLAVHASIAVGDALEKLVQPYGWSADMRRYYGWIAGQLQHREPIDSAWRETMGEKGFRRLVLAAWALEEDVVEAAPIYSAMW